MRLGPPPPEFATNRPSRDGSPAETVADAVNQMLDRWIEADVAPQVAIASAYFNVDGFTLLAERLAKAGPVRLLLGAVPGDYVDHVTITPLAALRSPFLDSRTTDAVARHAEALTSDRNLLGFDRTADRRAAQLVDWLDNHDVEVRRLTSSFLHGKAYLIDGGPAKAVLAGSSNLTYAGLTRNRELNLGHYQPGVVARTEAWFDEQWSEAEVFDLAGLYRSRFELHSPTHVFLRMLLELYGDDVTREHADGNELGLTDFQRDGVWRARRILRRRGGVIVADEVGLGKTYLAGELLREAAVERRQKVLLVAPATLRDSTWLPFLAKHNLPATVVSYDELVRDLSASRPPAPRLEAPDEYAMVIVDEAHSLRNPRTRRADAMRQLLSGSVPKDLVMLTATPVNNGLDDLRTLISYITNVDAAFADIDVPSLDEYFARAMALDPDELSGRHLYDLLDAIAVRRTRRFIKQNYPNERVNGEPIVFPQAVVKRVDYQLTEVLPNYFRSLAAALGAHIDDALFVDGVIEQLPSLTGELPALSMARYVPSHYKLVGVTEQYQVQNAGLLRSALLKRFESSIAAYRSTLETMIRSHRRFLAALDQGRILTGDALRAWVASDSDDIDVLVESFDEETVDLIDDTQAYDVPRLRGAVSADLDLLTSLHAPLDDLTPHDDPKLASLLKTLAEIVEGAALDGASPEDTRDKQKVLVFTYFADTADYLATAVASVLETDDRLAAYRDRLVVVTGSDTDSRRAAIVGFAPRTAGSPTDSDRYDLAIATDVLSEGVNLQQARHVINYDLPWNPMRLVQRHGRVDRIGSHHRRIILWCFFPDRDLESLLQLEERLQRKLRQAAAAFGSTAVLPGTVAVERVLGETRSEILRLQSEDARLFNDQGGATASSEEYRRRLERALTSRLVNDQVRALPWGAGAVLERDGGDAGIVFCARVADHPRPYFRWVPLDPQSLHPRHSDVPEIVDELLACLDQADPGITRVSAGSTADRTMREAAIDAWPHVRASIFEAWSERTDPAALQPRVPKVMHDAAALVHSRGGFLGERQPQLVRSLRQPVDLRVQRQFRAILRSGSARATIERLNATARELRLSPPTPIEPFPPVALDDVRLVVWMGIRPLAETYDEFRADPPA